MFGEVESNEQEDVKKAPKKHKIASKGKTKKKTGKKRSKKKVSRKKFAAK